jgi:hypothetical protein
MTPKLYTVSSDDVVEVKDVVLTLSPHRHRVLHHAVPFFRPLRMDLLHHTEKNEYMVAINEELLRHSKMDKKNNWQSNC